MAKGAEVWLRERGCGQGGSGSQSVHLNGRLPRPSTSNPFRSSAVVSGYFRRWEPFVVMLACRRTKSCEFSLSPF